MTVQEFYDYCKEHGYLDYQMTTYDFDGYEEEVLFEPYNELYTPSEVYGFMAYLLVKNKENRAVNEDDLREYCRKRLAKEYRGV